MEQFAKLGIGAELLKAIGEHRFEKPSEIQEKAIPLVLKGKDVIGQSATGSGKTLVFGAGIIERVEHGRGIQALVMTPTRELAEQVAQSLKKFSRHYKFHIQEVYGGVGFEGQIRGMQKAEIVVGTPGRLLDHIDKRNLNLSKIKILVLDEADRMADMGFLHDVETIIKECPKERQTMLFSATITQDVNYIAKKYMKNPESISAISYVDASKLKQIYYDVPSHMKFSLLVHLLKEDKDNLVMVFCNTRSNADMVVSNLRRFDVRALSIHGGMSQNKRNMSLKDFHEGRINILVCTDVAARGLDIKDVTHIYNYDLPAGSNEYIHRIGRTARAGKEGKAISIVSNRDYENFRKILMDDSLKIVKAEVPEKIEILTPKFERPRGRFSDRGGRDSGGRGGGFRRGGGRSFGGRSGGRGFGGRSYGGRSSSSRGSRSGFGRRF